MEVAEADGKLLEVVVSVLGVGGKVWAEWEAGWKVESGAKLTGEWGVWVVIEAWAAAGLQLVNMEWNSGAAGERVVELADILFPPLVLRSTLAGRAGYCSKMEPFLSSVQMVEKGMTSRRSDSGVKSSALGSAAIKASRRLSS